MGKQRNFCTVQRLLLMFIGLGLVACGPGGSAEIGIVRSEAGHDAMARDEPSEDVVELSPDQIRMGAIQLEDSRVIRLQEHLSATGAVSPNEARVAHIRPLARGVAEKVFVRRGDRVREGDPLILYDNIELGELIGEYLSQQARLQMYISEQEVARKFWERGVELLEAQAIAKKEVELREAQYRNAKAMVESQRSEIARSEEKLHRFGLTEKEIVALEDPRGSGGHRTATHSTLRAPFSGVIIGYNIAEGELVEPSRELMTLADVGTVWVLADVYEKDLARIREGQDVQIVSESYPGRNFQGRLTYISDVLEKETRTAQVRCVVFNPLNLLKLEMFVSVRIPTTDEKTGVAVPEGALQNLDEQDVVFVMESPGQFRSVPVTTGLKADGWIEVEGLAEGTPVVSKGSFYLKSTLKRSEIQVDED